jgi:hypothetical protein
MTFVNATVLAVACMPGVIDLYTLQGTLNRRLAINIISYGLVACADGCLLVLQRGRQRNVRVFSMDGVKIVTSPLRAHVFEGFTRTVAVHADRAYVLEEKRDLPRICVFE